jgi:hypothetical protein
MFLSADNNNFKGMIVYLDVEKERLRKNVGNRFSCQLSMRYKG